MNRDRAAKSVLAVLPRKGCQLPLPRLEVAAMSAVICRWPGVSKLCAAVVLCSAMAVSAQPIGGFSGKRAAAVDFKEAQRRLQQARLTRERGITPLTREHVSDGGARRLNENYTLRQARLERSLAAAEGRYRETTVALQAFNSQQ